jgi:hypothetical protein
VAIGADQRIGLAGHDMQSRAITMGGSAKSDATGWEKRSTKKFRKGVDDEWVFHSTSGEFSEDQTVSLAWTGIYCSDNGYLDCDVCISSSDGARRERATVTFEVWVDGERHEAEGLLSKREGQVVLKDWRVPLPASPDRPVKLELAVRFSAGIRPAEVIWRAPYLHGAKVQKAD